MVKFNNKFFMDLSDWTFNYGTPEDFVKSQWQTSSKCWWFLIYRWCLASFFIGTVITSITTAAQAGEFNYYFIYLTNWGIWLCMISTTLGAVLVTFWHFNAKFSVIIENDREMLLVLKIYWFLNNAAVVLALVITTIYWLILDNGTEMGVNNVLTHAMNAVMMILDLMLVRHIIRLAHFLYTVNIGILFAIFSVIYHVAGGTDRYGNNFIYEVLNWNELGGALITTFGTIILAVVMHFLVFLTQKSRTAICIKYFEKEVIDTTQSSVQQIV